MSAHTTQGPTVAIVGGGVTGLACALALARGGAAVTVHEAGPRAGEGALVRSGGMLAQGFESANEQLGLAFTALAARSLSLWPGWAREIEAASQIAVGFRQNGSIAPALQAGDDGWLAEMATGAARYGIEHDMLSGEKLRRLEPCLSGAVQSGLYFPQDGEVDNRALGPALVAAARIAGVDIQLNSPVSTLRDMAADTIVLACGPHAAIFADELPEAAHISPVKGQMLALDGTGLSLDQSLRGARIYLSQKPNGHIVAGATSEAGRADTQVETPVIDTLRQAAIEMVPALEQAKIVDRWAGIRPASPDGLPSLGASSQPGLCVALGSFRNGVLLAPAIGEAMADWILDGVAPDPAFNPARFVRR
tara:strand:- start:589 stop:1680 length:1092 start_codon:yes stop_codon:yes gene_type:complete